MRKMILGKALALLLANPCAMAQGQDQRVDPEALKAVEQFLNDPAAKAAYGKTHADAAEVNAFFAKFPPYAQQELNAIVMMIMRESGANANKHVQAYSQGGAQGAMNSFSPAVQSRATALMRRLENDPQFNSAANLKMMRSFMPQFLGAASS